MASRLAKAGAREPAESIARELGPERIHVVRVVVDGDIRPPDRTVETPDVVAESYWHLVEQGRST